MVLAVGAQRLTRVQQLVFAFLSFDPVRERPERPGDLAEFPVTPTRPDIRSRSGHMN